ncbi:MAG: selenium cofactor biosynthesis protein YqeC [Candidatus Krumholzibacteriia bacterium]
MGRARRRRTRSLARALGIGRTGVHAFVGAGGKSAAIRRLLAERPESVASTTTHLAHSGFGYGLLGVGSDAASLERMQPALLRARPLTLAVRGSDRTRLEGPELEWHLRLARAHPSRLFLVEADGAARRLVKRPAAHEPVWPPGPLERAVIVAGLSALGLPVADALHRPESFRRAGLGADTVGLEHLACMLRDYAESAPPRAPLTVLLTGVRADHTSAVADLARHLERVVRGRDPRQQDPGVALRVVATADVEAGAYDVWDLGGGVRSGVRLPGVSGVLLAAGLSARLRRPRCASKLLLVWGRRTLVEHAVQRWCRAGFPELVVVSGHEAARLEPLVLRAAEGFGTHVRIVRNRRYARGLGTSVRAAARAVPAGRALLFGHADMPAIEPATLRHIATVGSTLRSRIVVPTVLGAPRNPVFFPADLRGELVRVPDASGGRRVTRTHRDRVFELDLGARTDLVDVDRWVDLQRLLSPSGRVLRAPRTAS